VEFEWHCRLPAPASIVLHDDEHSAFRWMPIADACDAVWSWTNRDALWNLLLS
jgi:hypothetical protein